MKLAVMQPYLFPYAGYFQLIHAVDKFVFYDDVTYIKNGWINRNRLLLQGEPHYFTVPLSNASSFVPIRDVRFDAAAPWKRKLAATFEQAYASAPFRKEGMALLHDALDNAEGSIANAARGSVLAVLQYLGIARSIVETSQAYGNQDLKGEARIIDICRREGADVYVNAPGGRGLYDAANFRAAGVALKFLAPRLAPYDQGAGEFVPGLSVLDLIMRRDKDECRDMLASYALEEANVPSG
jgi:WbqC-like protein family